MYGAAQRTKMLCDDWSGVPQIRLWALEEGEDSSRISEKTHSKHFIKHWRQSESHQLESLYLVQAHPLLGSCLLFVAAPSEVPPQIYSALRGTSLEKVHISHAAHTRTRGILHNVSSLSMESTGGCNVATPRKCRRSCSVASSAAVYLRQHEPYTC